jgi:hypothetical protein
MAATLDTLPSSRAAKRMLLMPSTPARAEPHSVKEPAVMIVLAAGGLLAVARVHHSAARRG